MPWYFAYGSNLDRKQMERRVGRCRDSKRAILRGYALDFDRFSGGRWRGGVADVVKRKDGVVYGAVYMVTEDQLRKLDAWETGYRRSVVTVECDGRAEEAVAYTVIEPGRFRDPSEKYVETILRGLTVHGYSKETVSEVESQIRRMPAEGKNTTG